MKRVFQRKGGQRQIRKRIALVVLFFLFAFSVLVYRCLYLHLADDPKLEKIARSQYRTRVEEAPPRGNIYDAAGEELAVSVPAYSVAVRPDKIREREKVLRDLSRGLDLKPEEMAKKLDSERKFVWLKRHLTPREKEEVSRLSLEGIELVRGTRRFYPNREVASQILGAVGIDNEGLAGLELFYDRILRGGGEKGTAYRDARGKTFRTEETPEENEGIHHLTLTLRKNIQYVAETELNAACEKYRAKACTAVVLDPSSGAVLAMASTPTFNPNSYQSYDLGLWRNIAVTDTFEPGSTFKPILAAAALESGAVQPEDRFFCENGTLKLGKDHTLHDHDPHGMLSFREILKVSSNIGIYKVARRVGKKSFAGIIDLFGFGKKTGIDYPGEVAGYVPPARNWMEIEFATISFGQGVRVTPLQLASSFVTIANGGIRQRPYLVARVTDPEGRTVLERGPVPGGRVLTRETARRLLEMLKGVTAEGGTATLAALPGYTVAGKTGTAQKVVQGEYSHTKFVSSFVGIVPADQPRLVVLVMIDEPKGVPYGGLVAGPVFRKIAWASLIDLGVPPEKSTIPTVTEASMTSFSPLPFDLKGGGEGIPDFHGLSKRKVLVLLDQRGMEGEMIGSGVAVAQEPAPGSPLKKGEVCRIYFRPD